jgi:hypothetical protein
MGSCEHGTEPLSSIKCQEFPELLTSEEGLCSIMLVSGQGKNWGKIKWLVVKEVIALQAKDYRLDSR